MMTTLRVGPVLLALLAPPGAWAGPEARALRMEIANVASPAACPAVTRRCALGADGTGICRAEVRACVGSGAAGGIVRLRAGGTPGLAERLAAVLAALPGAAAADGVVAFSPPLAPVCASSVVVELPSGSDGSLVLLGLARGGRHSRAVVRFACGRALDTGAPPLGFEPGTVDPDGGQVTNALDTGDVDGDLRPDVVVGGDARLVWYRNPDWTQHEIARGRFGAGAMIVVRDLDGDGRLDVVTGAREPLETVWFHNGPTGWDRHLLSANSYCHDLAFGDLDGDGRADAACVDQKHGRLVWLHAPPDPTAPWARRIIDAHERAMGAAVVDLDGDGHPDVIAGRAWYRNDPTGWTRHPFTDIRVGGYEAFDDYVKVSVLDLNRDGRLDVFATLYAETPVGRVYAFLAPPDPRRDRWTAVPIDPGPLFGVHSQAATSFDGSIRPQVMVAETDIGGFDFGTPPDPHVYVYRLLGDAADPAAWERTAIAAGGTHDACAVDLQPDGLPDLVGHEENTNLVGTNGPVQLWMNRTGS